MDFEPNGGAYIYSASEAYHEEQKIDHQRSVNWLCHCGLKVVGGLPGAEKGPYHASRHINGPALEGVIEQIGAERVLPVHTQQPEWFEQRWADKMVRAGYGVPGHL